MLREADLARIEGWGVGGRVEPQDDGVVEAEDGDDDGPGPGGLLVGTADGGAVEQDDVGYLGREAGDLADAAVSVAE